MTIALIFGAALFLGLMVVILSIGPRASDESILLANLTQEMRDQGRAGADGWRTALSVDSLAHFFGPIRWIFSSKPDPDLAWQLMLAGYRKPAHAEIFLGVRLALPAFLGLLVALAVTDNLIFYFPITLIISFYTPNFWLGRAVRKRQTELASSLPDALDLLAICMEAGMGLDQGMLRVGHELMVSHKALSEELLQINFEQRAGVARVKAWQDFADRSDKESIRSFIAMLIQTDRFGTPISKSLGAFSDSLRTQRRQKAEEQAAKATIKLVPPLVFFIFPSVGIVLIGPAVITLMKNLEHLVK